MLRCERSDDSCYKVLFDRSIRENLTYGLQRHVSDAELEQAAQSAHAHEFISKFPQGYDTEPGEKVVFIRAGALAEGGDGGRVFE